MHKTVTLDRIVQTLEDTAGTLLDPGICIACGEDQDGCEGDAENYECNGCGKNKVFGVSGLLMHLL